MINVLVTAVGGRSVGFHVMRSLLRETDKFNVKVCDMNPNAAGLYYMSDYDDWGFVVPPCTSNKYIPKLNEIVEKYKIDIIIPGSEPELYVLSDRRDEINTKLLINPRETINICRDKAVLYKWLNSFEYNVPDTYSWKDLENLIHLEYPLVVKPTKKTGGSRNVKLLMNDTELLDYVHVYGTDDKVFQKYVSTPYDEYTVGVVVYRNHTNVDSIVMHRILDDISLLESRTYNDKTYAISTGLSQVITIKFGAMRDFCEGLAKDIGIEGPCNIQLRLSYDDSKGPIFHVFEVHPRFSGTSYMRASIGFNDSARLVENFVLGKIPNRMKYEFNATLLKYLDHVIKYA